MAFKIFSSQYSFIDIVQHTPGDPIPGPANDWVTDPCPGTELAFCLPIAEEDDLKFQFFVQATTAPDQAKMAAIPASHVNILLVPNVGSGGPTVWSDPSSGSELMQKVQLDTDLWMFYWKYPLTGLFDVIAPNQCFRLLIQLYQSYTPGLPVLLVEGLSPCFVRDDSCWSVLLNYQSDQDYADFVYCAIPDAANQVRIPMHLKKPQFVEDEELYVTSNGYRDVSKSVVSKLYEVETDWMPENVHEALQAALRHDLPMITAPNYEGQVSKDGAYEIEWRDEMAFPHAQAKFKLYAIPYQLKKDLCGVCAFESTGVTGAGVNLGAFAGCHTFTIDLTTLFSSTNSLDYEFVVVGTVLQSSVINDATQTAILQIDTLPAVTIGATVILCSVKATTPSGESVTVNITGHWDGTYDC